MSDSAILFIVSHRPTRTNLTVLGSTRTGRAENCETKIPRFWPRAGPSRNCYDFRSGPPIGAPDRIRDTFVGPDLRKAARRWSVADHRRTGCRSWAKRAVLAAPESPDPDPKEQPGPVRGFWLAAETHPYERGTEPGPKGKRSASVLLVCCCWWRALRGAGLRKGVRPGSSRRNRAPETTRWHLQGGRVVSATGCLAYPPRTGVGPVALRHSLSRALPFGLRVSFLFARPSRPLTPIIQAV